MENTPAKKRGRRGVVALYLGAIFVVLLGGGIALVLYLRSPQFSELVRQKVVASLEDVKIGRAHV